MKLAIIDIGSNSVRLLLATYENNEWRYEPKQLWTTRLGQRNTDGTLRAESMEASYQAFTDIKKMVLNIALVLLRALFVKPPMDLHLWNVLIHTVLWSGEFYLVLKRPCMAFMAL